MDRRSLLRDIFRDDTPTASRDDAPDSDDEQPNHYDSNEDSPSPPALIVNSEKQTGRRNSPTVTPKRPGVLRPFRHRKIIKAAKTNPTNIGVLLSQLQKTNATMFALAEKVERAEKRMRNMEKKVKRSKISSSNSSSSNLKKVVPFGIRVRL